MIEDKKQIREALERQFFNCNDSKCFISSNDKGCIVVGNSCEVITAFTLLVRQLKEEAGEERLRYAFELAFKDSKELEKEALSKIKELIEEIEKED